LIRVDEDRFGRDRFERPIRVENGGLRAVGDSANAEGKERRKKAAEDAKASRHSAPVPEIVLSMGACSLKTHPILVPEKLSGTA